MRQAERVLGAIGETAQQRCFVSQELHVVGDGGAPVDAADAGHRCHVLGIDRGHIARGRAAVAMADQIDLVRPGGGEDGLDLARCLFAPHLGGIEGGHLQHKHLGTTLAQLIGNAIPVADAENVIKTTQAVDQHNGIAGLGIVVGEAGGGQ